MIGCPISWKKNKRGVENTWLGFSVNSHTGLAWLPDIKKNLVTQILTALESGDTFKAKQILEALGLLQWTATAFPSMRPFLQPMYAWQRATLVAGRPGVLVKYLAATVLTLLKSPLKPIFHDGIMSNWQGAADAGASDTSATIGGWISDLSGDVIAKNKVWWFSYKMDKIHQPWAFDKGAPKLRIAALELMATVLLVHYSGSKNFGSAEIMLPLRTDNQGNAFSVRRNYAKKWPNAAIMMELAMRRHNTGIRPHLSHVNRDQNVWADQLTHSDFNGFDENLRMTDDINKVGFWLVLPRLMALHSEATSGNRDT
jgi:hypothetical protein